MSQIALRGFSVTAVVISYALALATVVFSAVYVQGCWELSWTIFYSLIFINISFEFERWMRISFLQHLRIKESDREKNRALLRRQQLEAELTGRNHQLLLADMAEENKMTLAHAEKRALRSLMGNVAHDLK